MLSIYPMIWGLLDGAGRRRFVRLVALMVLTGIFDLLGVALILPFLAVVAQPDVILERAGLAALFRLSGAADSFAFLQMMGAATFVFVILGIAVRTLTFYRVNHFVRGMIVALSHRRLEGYLARPYEWFLDRHSAELSKSVLQEITEAMVGAVAPAIRLIANALVLVLLALFLIWVEPVGACVIGATFGLGFGVVYRMLGGKLGDMGRDRLVANRERHQIVGEALTGIKEIKVLGLEGYYLDRYLDPSRRLARHQANVALIGELPRYAIEALIFGGMLLFLMWLLWSREGALAEVVPVIGAFAFTAIKLMPTAQTLFRDVSLASYGRPALRSLARDLSDMPQAGPTETGPALVPRREIALRGVSYGYPGSEGTALDEMTLIIPVGARIGVAGSTGAGKTTVIDLLLGLIEPQTGRLEVDGTPVTGRTLRRWQRCIGYVPQSIHLVDDTVLGNITRGVPGDEIDHDAVRRAAAIAQLDAVIGDLPRGIDTVIGEAGVRLSGGQRQRIGIARALYRNPDLLILDEATSALDAVTENAVLDGIAARAPGKTVVMITHRLRSLDGCGRIYFLEHGRIAAEGDFATLQRDSAGFRAMLRAAA